MNDLVERLRLLAQEVEPDFGGTLDEAADEIERLRIELSLHLQGLDAASDEIERLRIRIDAAEKQEDYQLDQIGSLRRKNDELITKLRTLQFCVELDNKTQQQTREQD